MAALVVVIMASSGCIWSGFRYGPERTGYNPDETSIGVANVGTLTLKWTAAAGGPVASSPAIVSGTVYLSEVGGSFRAFDANGSTGCSGTPKTCAPLWTAELDGSSRSSPAVSGGVVYVGSEIFTFFPESTDGALYAFDAAGATGCSGTPKTCTPLWTADTGDFVSSSPTIANGFVYVGSDGLRAYDAAGATGCSGAPKVCAPVFSGRLGFTVSSPAVAGGVAYQFTAGTLEAYDATGTTGCSGTPTFCTPTWTSLIGSDSTSPAVSGGLLYIGSKDGLLRAYKTTPTFPQCTGTAPKTCSPKWSVALGGAISSSAAVANGVVYVGAGDGDLHALDATTGALLWTAPTGADVTSSPAVANGVVYVGSNDGELYAFDAAGNTGCSGTPKVCAPLWSHLTGGAVTSSPAVVNGTVYVGSEDGKLYAFALPVA